jgi:outer membrane protein assembly factor BamB
MRASPYKTPEGRVRSEAPRRVPTLVRRALVLALASAAVALGLWAFAVARQALVRIDQARRPARDAVRFDRRRLDPLSREGIRLFQATRSARAVERFGDAYFVATDGGLVELSPQGRVVRRFDVLDGLGESDLTCLAVCGGRLYVGTRSKGLLSFDGERFEQYVWPEREAKSITALAVDQGKLLVGTFAGGLLEFDGEGFTELRAGEDKARLDAVTFAARFGPRLYVGTFNAGLWVAEGGRWSHFTSSDGLASDRVVGVVEIGGESLAASDFGLSAAPSDGLALAASAREGRAWRTILTLPSISGVAESSGRLILCKDDGEFASLNVPRGGESSLKAQEIDWTKPQAARSDARLAASDGGLWLLDSGGVRRYDESPAASGADAAKRRVTFADFGAEDAAQSPTSNVVSALAFDSAGRLWAGSFRNGVDVFAPGGARLAHLESDELREINALTPDAWGGVLAATSQGLFRLDSSLRPARLDGTDARHGGSVTHVARLDTADGRGAASAKEKQAKGKEQTDQLAVATPLGLSLDSPGGARVLTTVQGLPSNSVYAVWPASGHVYAGTLGGLAEISSGRVTRVFKDSNSALSVNWVTAIRGARGRMFVGTYGGGVFELLPAGDLRPLAAEAGRVFVNQNAMWADDDRLYVGTLDGALVFDLHTQKWARVRDELPSQTVLSVTGRGDQIYFGTTAGLARFDGSFFDKRFQDAAE